MELEFHEHYFNKIILLVLEKGKGRAEIFVRARRLGKVREEIMIEKFNNENKSSVSVQNL